MICGPRRFGRFEVFLMLSSLFNGWSFDCTVLIIFNCDRLVFRWIGQTINVNYQFMTLNWKVLLFMDARDIFKLPQLNATKYECRRKYKKRREKHFETNWKISSIVFRRNGKKANFNCFETSWKSIVCLMTELFSQFKLRLFTVSDYLKSTRLIIFKTLAAFFLSLLHQKQWNYGKMATVRNELKREREMRKILRNQWTKKIEIKWNF